MNSLIWDLFWKYSATFNLLNWLRDLDVNLVANHSELYYSCNLIEEYLYMDTDAFVGGYLVGSDTLLSVYSDFRIHKDRVKVISFILLLFTISIQTIDLSE